MPAAFMDSANKSSSVIDRGINPSVMIAAVYGKTVALLYPTKMAIYSLL